MNIEIALNNINGKDVPAVTSLQVAEAFGKEHFNVLRDIETILLQVPENFRKLNFEVSEYTIQNPLTGGELPKPMYLLTKDAFTLLTMGYTGEKALAIKLAYIEAFNAMEEELARRSRPALPADPFPCSVEECRRLMREIDDLYAGKRNDLEHLKDRLVEVTFNVMHTLLRKYRIPFTAGGEGPGLHSTIHQCLFSMLCEGFSMRRPGLYEGFNPGWHLLGIMSQIEKVK